MSRAELAKQTGLTKVTMSLLVSMLVDNGVVREGTPSVQSPPMGVPARRCSSPEADTAASVCR